MSELDKVIRLKKFPLEAEVIATAAQRELARLNKEELLAYSQQSTLVMSQLRHYCTELINAMEERGFIIDTPEG